MEDLRFKYTCSFCMKEVRMNTKDIINFIGKRYGTPDGDQLDQFFDKYGKDYNLCTTCAREEGFEVDDFEGWEDENEKTI